MSGALAPVLAALLAAAPGGDWPGLPPDCWQAPRIVHSVQDLGDHWRTHVHVARRKAGKPPAGEVSPNKGYAFAVEGTGPEARVTVYAEKDHVVEIAFRELHGLSEARWISEKLIFLRAWWGRLAATDLIYDAEREEFVYAETATDGTLAWRQFAESCPTLGCRCIGKR